MTDTEKQEIINAVIQSLRTNSVTIGNLTPIAEVGTDDSFELNNARRVTFSTLNEQIKSGITPLIPTVPTVAQQMPEILDSLQRFGLVVLSVEDMVLDFDLSYGGGAPEDGRVVFDYSHKKFVMVGSGRVAENYHDSEGLPRTDVIFNVLADHGLYIWQWNALKCVLRPDGRTNIVCDVAYMLEFDSDELTQVGLNGIAFNAVTHKLYNITEDGNHTVFASLKPGCIITAKTNAYGDFIYDGERLIEKYDRSDQAAQSEQLGINTLAAQLSETEKEVEDARWSVFEAEWVQAGGTLNEDRDDALRFLAGAGVALGFEEAVGVLEACGGGGGALCGRFAGFAGRGLLPVRGGAGLVADGMCAGARALEAVEVAGGAEAVFAPSSMRGAFAGCGALVSVVGVLAPGDGEFDGVFAGCGALREVRLSGARGALLSLADCAVLSDESLAYLVEHAANGAAAMTVALHPDVYARVTADPAGAIVAAAVAKKISFATLS